MKLSSKSRYGLRAMVELACAQGEGLLSLSSIAKRQQISEAYLEQLIAKLKKAGLVNAGRGASGGYELSKPAADISVGDVLRAVEGNLDAIACAGLADGGQSPSGGCAGADACVTKYVWQKINESITECVDGITLDTLASQAKRTQ